MASRNGPRPPAHDRGSQFPALEGCSERDCPVHGPMRYLFLRAPRQVVRLAIIGRLGHTRKMYWQDFPDFSVAHTEQLRRGKPEQSVENSTTKQLQNFS